MAPRKRGKPKTLPIEDTPKEQRIQFLKALDEAIHERESFTPVPDTLVLSIGGCLYSIPTTSLSNLKKLRHKVSSKWIHRRHLYRADGDNSNLILKR